MKPFLAGLAVQLFQTPWKFLKLFETIGWERCRFRGLFEMVGSGNYCFHEETVGKVLLWETLAASS